MVIAFPRLWMRSFVTRCVVSAAFAALTACGNGGLNTTPIPGSNTDTEFTIAGRSIYESESIAGTSSAARVAQALPGARKIFLRGIAYSPQPNGVEISANTQNFNSNVLGNANSAVWSRDLENMRAAGINAIRVYNVPPPQYDGGNNIDNFLDAAWNNDNSPIFVIMAIDIGARGAALLDNGAVNSLVGQYAQLATKYASKPALLGIAVGNEIANPTFVQNPTWWANFNKIATSTKRAFVASGHPGKLVMNAEIDDINTVIAGEANKVAIDVWGINSYRGRTFTDLTTRYAAATSKPILLTEYGASAAYHPSINAAYAVPPAGNKTQTVGCTLNGGVFQPPFPPTTPTDIAELPLTGSRSMAGLTDFVTNTTTLIHDSYLTDGVLSGGFYFEWTDEWFKVGDVPGVATGTQHLGNVPGVNGAAPGCSNDEGWFGLNAAAPGNPGVLTPRPSLDAISKVWKSEASS